MEKELKIAKRMNKAVMILIVVMLILMNVLVLDLARLKKQYDQLEVRYMKLYEEMAGGNLIDGNLTGSGNVE